MANVFNLSYQLEFRAEVRKIDTALKLNRIDKCDPLAEMSKLFRFGYELSIPLPEMSAGVWRTIIN